MSARVIEFQAFRLALMRKLHAQGKPASEIRQALRAVDKRTPPQTRPPSEWPAQAFARLIDDLQKGDPRP